MRERRDQFSQRLSAMAELILELRSQLRCSQAEIADQE